MALKDIMAISGQSGLFKFVSQGRNGIIVESLVDGKRSHVSASAKVSSLSDIAIFTNDGEKPLREVMDLIKQKENSGPSISHKSTNDELKNYFISVVSDYDVERVYVSDIKKVFSWYNQLQGIGMLDFAEEIEEKAEEDPEEKAKDETTAEKPAAKKKAPAKKSAAEKVVTPKRTPSPRSKSMGEGGVKKNIHQKKT